MAASIIDAFMVTLGLDSTAFDKNAAKAKKTQQDLSSQAVRSGKERETADRKLDEAQRKRQADADKRAKGAADGFKQVRNEVLKLAAVFTAGIGIKDFFTNTINDAASLGYLSTNLDMSTERIRALQRASERAGGSVDGMTAQLKESADTLAQLKLGMGPNEGLQNFFRFGGSSADLQNGNTYLMARSKIIHDMFQVDPTKAALMARQVGISEDQFNLIKQGPEAIRELVDAQMKRVAISKEDAAAALALRNQMLDLRDSLTQTATRIVLQLAPSLEKLAAELERGAAWLASHQDTVREWIDSLVSGVKSVVEVANQAADAVGGWKNMLLIIAGLKVAGMVSGLVSIGAAIAGIGASALGSIPGLVAATAALGAYAGYKITDKLFGNERTRLMDKNRDILNGGTGDAKTKSMDELRAEAKRQRVAAGLEHITPIGLMSKDALRAEAARQMAEAGLGGNASVMQKLVGMGWTAEQAAGIAGSLKQESQLNPGAQNPNSGAYGIGQWLSRDRIANFEKVIGKPLRGSSMDDQLKFQQWELTEGPEKAAGDRLRAARTAEEAAMIHRKYYERPGEDEANDAARMRYAAQFAAQGRISNASAAASVPVGAPASAAGRVDNSRSSTSTSETNINGGITIVTQATDTDGIAREIKPAIEKYNSTMQANTGIR